MSVDPDRPRGPRGLADGIAVKIATLQQEIAAATCQKERKRLRGVLRLNREMLAWCKTRAGY